MATDTVPARTSSVPIGDAWWFRLVVRTALVLLSFWALSLAADRYGAFLQYSRTYFRNANTSVWLSWLGWAVAAGFLFGLATWLPFGKVRYLPSRLLLAVVAFVPLARFWWALMQGHVRTVNRWVAQVFWFDEVQIQFVLAALAGVAIASGFRARRSRPAPAVSLSVQQGAGEPGGPYREAASGSRRAGGRGD